MYYVRGNDVAWQPFNFNTEQFPFSLWKLKRKKQWQTIIITNILALATLEINVLTQFTALDYKWQQRNYYYDFLLETENFIA